MKTIFQGAEATITKQKNTILKDRTRKSYRIEQLDEKLRAQRTRKEVKLLEKSIELIKVPRISSFSNYSIALEEIKGRRLAECLDNAKDKAKIAKEIGKSLSKLHDIGIIHGDLTTSNLIKAKDGIYFIDFGLGYESFSVEDKAVDLHVFHEALQAKHPKIAKEFFMKVIQAYSVSKNSSPVLKRLELVQTRGRYKQQY